MNNQPQLFKSESPWSDLSDSEKLGTLVKAGREMRVAQNGYFSARPGPDKQELLKLSKVKERQFDHFIQAFAHE